MEINKIYNEDCIEGMKKEIEWIENLITSFLKGADVSMGIICKTVKQADKLYAAINHLSDKICLLTEESVAFVNGVVITTAHMAKGSKKRGKTF